MHHPGIPEEILGNDLDSEQMVPGTVVEDNKPTYTELETLPAENYNLEEIKEVNPQIIGVDTTEITTLVDDLYIFTDNKDINTYNYINE